jgi:molecular chaperone GrpE
MAKNKDKSRLEQLEKQVADLDQQFKRALADYQNLEKRHHNDRQSLVKYANQTLLDKLLPLLDDLERAQNHLKNPGLKQVINQFISLLESEGVTLIKSTGELFNPQEMDCAEVVPGKKNFVVKTLNKGYYYLDRVLRPARVEVGNGIFPKIKN